MTGFGNRIKILRNSVNLTQQQFADRLKITRAHVSNLETERREPSDIIIKAICIEFGVREQWLRDGIGSMKPDIASGLDKVFASYFIEIQKAMSPSCETAEHILTLFRQKPISDMYNYIAYRLYQPDAKQNEIATLMQLFDVAFPGYADVVAALSRRNAKRRSDIMESKYYAQLPVPIQGRAAAGEPVFDQLEGDDFVFVPEKYLDGRFFVVEAKGDSMEPRIRNGDRVVVKKDEPALPGEVALVRVDGIGEDEYTIKIYNPHNGSVELISINPAYKPMTYKATEIKSVEKIVYIIQQ